MFWRYDFFFPIRLFSKREIYHFRVLPRFTRRRNRFSRSHRRKADDSRRQRPLHAVRFSGSLWISSVFTETGGVCLRAFGTHVISPSRQLAKTRIRPTGRRVPNGSFGPLSDRPSRRFRRRIRRRDHRRRVESPITASLFGLDVACSQKMPIMPFSIADTTRHRPNAICMRVVRIENNCVCGGWKQNNDIFLWKNNVCLSKHRTIKFIVHCATTKGIRVVGGKGSVD